MDDVAHRARACGRPARRAGVNIRRFATDEWPEVEAIYAAGIETGNATFELQPPPLERFIESHTPELTLVAHDGERPIGWVAAGPVGDRYVYAGVVQHSVYVDPAAQGRGVGRALLGALFDGTEARGIWTVQSGSSPRTWRASGSTRRAGSGSSAAVNASDSTTVAGETCSPSNGAAPSSASIDFTLDPLPTQLSASSRPSAWCAKFVN